MAANDHLQGEQLRMFMPARELYNMPSSDVGATTRWKTQRAMHMTKRRENKTDGLDADVAARGVHVPAIVAHTGDGAVTSDGHHRIVAAYDANPDSLVPVEHEDWGRRTYGDFVHGQRQAPGWEPTNRFPSYP